MPPVGRLDRGAGVSQMGAIMGVRGCETGGERICSSKGYCFSWIVSL